MTKQTTRAAIVAMALTGGLTTAQAQTTPTTAAAPKPAPAAEQGSSFEDFAKSSKNPADWITWGADLRVRDEWVDNASMTRTTAEERDYLRFRTRLWTTITPVTDLSLNARMAWEARYFFRPDTDAPGIRLSTTTQPNYSPHSGVFDEMLLDNLNIRATNLFGQPLSITAGRQDYLTGPGSAWWLMDGSPLDGSRTYFLDSARVVLNLENMNTVVNGIAIAQRARSDSWLPPINPQTYRNYLTEQNQTAGILYLENKSLKNTQLDLYFILDSDDKELANGNNGWIYAFGAKGNVSITDNLSFYGEIMPQFGSHRNYTVGTPTQNFQALAANSQLSYSFKDKLSNSVRAGYEFLSGDDPNTTTWERADLLWGRYPRYAEILPYNATTGPRAADYGNYHRFFAGWTIKPAKKVQFSLDYHALFAVEQETVAGVQTTGDFRGHLVVALLEYTHNKHLKAHLRGEIFAPGSYYNGTGLSKEMETFVRGEIYLTW